jgi:hypothetical protein
MSIKKSIQDIDILLETTPEGTALSSNITHQVSNPYTILNSPDVFAVNDIVASVTGGPGLNLGAAQSILDCAASLEDRIVNKLQQDALSWVASNAGAKNVITKLGVLLKYAGAAASIVDMVKNRKEEDLLSALLACQKLIGAEQLAKIAEIQQKFGGVVDNINDILGNIASLDICNIPNYSSTGLIKNEPVLVPVGPPAALPPTGPGASVNTNFATTRNDYDDVMYKLKDYTGKDSSRLGTDSDVTLAAQYQTMLTALNTITYAYHDKIYKTTDASNYEAYHKQYLASIAIERSKYTSSWSPEIIEEFDLRARGAGEHIKGSAESIQRYGMRNTVGPVNGSLLATGVTTYSGAATDLTTFLEIKREERPADAVAYWSSRVNIADQERKMIANGHRVSYIPFSWSVSAAYGKLESDFTCASTRVPGGSVLALKNPDGTIYNPSGKNPAGLFTVTDTGKAELTYKKVDIYTDTPKLYKNMDQVQVFLVSAGTKTNSQYALAQKKYGGGNAIVV